MNTEDESIEFWRGGIESECDDKDKESSEWEKGDCSVLAPVASGAVDTGEVVGVDWWGIARHTATTQLTLSVVTTAHELIELGGGVDSYRKEISFHEF